MSIAHPIVWIILFRVLLIFTSYHLPKHIQEHIDYVTPGLKLLANRNNKRGFGMSKGGLPISPPMRAPIKGPIDPNSLRTCDIAITPACIAAAYGIPPGTKA